MANKTITPKTRKIVYNKFNGHCAYCGNAFEQKRDMQVDHIISKYNFQHYLMNSISYVPKWLRHLKIDEVNHIDNLFPSCRNCNFIKSAFTLETFKKEIMDQVRRANKYSANYRLAKKYGLVKEIDKEVVFYFEQDEN